MRGELQFLLLELRTLLGAASSVLASMSLDKGTEGGGAAQCCWDARMSSAPRAVMLLLFWQTR